MERILEGGDPLRWLEIEIEAAEIRGLPVRDWKAILERVPDPRRVQEAEEALERHLRTLMAAHDEAFLCQVMDEVRVHLAQVEAPNRVMRQMDVVQWNCRQAARQRKRVFLA
jgi:hypothetical protein